MLNYIAQGIGFVGLLIAAISFQKNSNKGILYYQITSTSIFFVHFMMLGAFTGALMNLLGAGRNIVFFNKGKSWADKKYWLYVFMFLYFLAGILTWKNAFSILPIIGMILQTIALKLKNPRHTRFLSLIVSPCWLIYNVSSASIAGILTEIFISLSVITAVIRFDLGFKKPAAKESLTTHK